MTPSRFSAAIDWLKVLPILGGLVDLAIRIAEGIRRLRKKG